MTTKNIPKLVALKPSQSKLKAKLTALKIKQDKLETNLNSLDLTNLNKHDRDLARTKFGKSATLESEDEFSGFVNIFKWDKLDKSLAKLSRGPTLVKIKGLFQSKAKILYKVRRVIEDLDNGVYKGPKSTEIKP